MADYMSRYAVPGQNSGIPVSNKDVSDVYIPGTDDSVGEVTSVITNSGLTVTNKTRAGHIFDDGQITRMAIQASDGSWSITTLGIGNNKYPVNLINQLSGPYIFNEMDRAMARNITHDQGLR